MRVPAELTTPAVVKRVVSADHSGWPASWSLAADIAYAPAELTEKTTSEQLYPKLLLVL
jgi:hypothetical protein